MSREPIIQVIGGGLAGCEAAYHAARYPVRVILHEMKPGVFSPAHQRDDLAELVCSNSLRSNSLDTPAGRLKADMRRLGSLVIGTADEYAVPAGQALAVDRTLFSRAITERIESHPRIEVRREEVKEIPSDGTVIIATGPLCSAALSDQIGRKLGKKYLYFYDAISPIVYADTVDSSSHFRASRYGKGGDDYVNIPLDREQYEGFVRLLREGETVPLYDFEKALYFEGCLPVEVLAERGVDTLAHGPMKPVGLADPRTGRVPHAVVQLRQENKEGSLLSMVGFQTKLRYPEQRRIFRTLPGMSDARFARLGLVHRNTYINAPLFLDAALRLRKDPRIMFAGQIAGVEGYVESAALGILAGLNAGALASGQAPAVPPPTTGIGALIQYVAHGKPDDFQPMNINFGLFAPLETDASLPKGAGQIPRPGAHPGRRPGARSARAYRRARILERAEADLEQWLLASALPEIE